MAPTEGRVAKPERQWGCRRSTPRYGVMKLLWIIGRGAETKFKSYTKTEKKSYG